MLVRGVAVIFALGLVTPVSVVGLPCTADHLASFKETTIAGPVNKCMSASEVRFSMPPTADLTETQRNQVCDEKICKEMIAALDDMDIPRCDLLYSGKNVTLQASLDRFTAICDAPRSRAPEVKKRSAKKSDASSADAIASRVGIVATVITIAIAASFH